MNYEQMNNNQLTLTGVVSKVPKFSHEVFKEGFFETSLSVTRLSGQVDEVPITVSERLLLQHDIKVGDRISVVGQFRSYNKVEGEKSRLLLTAFVRDIVEVDSVNSNNIEIIGYVCKMPVYRTTPFKREICDMLIAVNRAYNKSDYIPCILWGRNARFSSTLSIGTKLALSGRIQSRTYVKTLEDMSTQERVAYEVSVSKIEVVPEDFDDKEKSRIASTLF